MKSFAELRENPPKFNLNDLNDKKEIIFTCVNSKTDLFTAGYFYIHLKRDNNNAYQLEVRSARWTQMDFHMTEIKTLRILIEWNADINAWDEVFQAIQAGPQMIASFKTRA